MSEWYEPKTEDIKVNHATEEVDIFVKQNDFGAVYATLTFQQVEDIYLEMKKPPEINNE